MTTTNPDLLTEARARTDLFDRALALKAQYGVTTKHAYFWAKGERDSGPMPDHDERDSRQGLTTFYDLTDRIDGFDITISVTYDEYERGDDFLGSWVNARQASQYDPRDLVVHETSWGEPSVYFHAEYGYEDRYTALRRDHTKAESDRLAREGIRDDYNRFKDYESWYVKVTAKVDGHELGESMVVGGLTYDEDSPLDESTQVWQFVTEHALVDEAIDDAHTNAARLVSELTARIDDLNETIDRMMTIDEASDRFGGVS